VRFDVVDVEMAHLAQWAAMRAELWPGDDPAELLAEASPYFGATPGRIDSTPHVVLVARLGGSRREIVGFLELSVRSHAAHVEAWYTKPAFRMRGIGRALAQEATARALRAGCSVLTSDTIPQQYPASTPAHLALGFRRDTPTPAIPGEERFRMILAADQSRS
jgi:aminoglycoside 6'-N-acetyltransferase I